MKTCKSEGCNSRVFGGGYCLRHQTQREKPTMRKRISIREAYEKKRSADRQYYIEAINLNKKKNNGICMCDECGNRIHQPTGSNVAHIISKGANNTLYHDIRNHVILGKGAMFGECDCLWKFDNSGNRLQMRIYDHTESIRELLNYEYYQKKI